MPYDFMINAIATDKANILPNIMSRNFMINVIPHKQVTFVTTVVINPEIRFDDFATKDRSPNARTNGYQSTKFA